MPTAVVGQSVLQQRKQFPPRIIGVYFHGGVFARARMRHNTQFPRRLNLASYVSTWMEDAADEIFSFAKNVNLADSVQYPSSTLMERRRVLLPWLLVSARYSLLAAPST